MGEKSHESYRAGRRRWNVPFFVVVETISPPLVNLRSGGRRRMSQRMRLAPSTLLTTLGAHEQLSCELRRWF